MAEKSSQVVVDGRAVKVTNLSKVLYPATGTTKGEVIAYYQAVAPWFVPHSAGRIATRKRWPDGIGTTEHPKKPFFHKNLDPRSTPEWVRTFTVQHASGDNTYPLVDDAATLVWLAQLAALEIHVPQWWIDATDTPQHPDRLVLDLDPGEGAGLAQCVEVAHLIRGILDDVGLTAVPVTSGSKGIHLYAGLDGAMTSDEASDWARQLARSLESLRPELVVSDMKKTLREGKVLLDWSQNNGAKTTIAPYSLRGREHPTVAAPRTWEELDDNLRHLEFDEVLDRLQRLGDPLAVLLRDRAEDPAPQPSGAPESPSPDRPSTDRLSQYRSMRDAAKTPEPVPAASPTARDDGRLFVIQEHHARRLHWDLRLERDGALASWALPKGPPTDPQTNHLAVQTEDHPLEYATFSGTIPKGEYGAGSMTIWDTGTFEAEKWREGREVIFTLTGQPDGGLGGVPRKYALIHTGHGQQQKNWLIHLMAGDDTSASEPATPKLPVLEPMLATPGALTDVTGPDWRFEVKWDGYRATASVADGRASFRSRGGQNLTAAYPELGELAHLLGDHSVVLDGEIVVLDETGRPQFELLQTHAQHPGSARYMVFDLLHLDGRSLLRIPYAERRGELQGILGNGGRHIKVPDDLGDDAEVALEVSAEQGLEGIVAKKVSSVYQPGRRARTWIKIKNLPTADVVIVGWAPGENRRARTIGSLLLALPAGDGWRYVGKVGSGFTEQALQDARKVLSEIEIDQPAVPDVPAAEAHDTHWVEPLLVGEVKYGEWTSAGRLRHPVWKGWRTDRTPEDLAADSGAG